MLEGGGARIAGAKKARGIFCRGLVLDKVDDSLAA
jgi:hypothetical protein